MTPHILTELTATRPLRLIAGLGVCVALLSGCVTNTVVADAAKAAFEDRLAEQQIVDAKIKSTIIENNFNIDKMLALDLSVDVWKTRVMITGLVSDPAQREQVQSAALGDTRISRLFNDIQVVSADTQAERRDWKQKAEAGAQKTAEVFDDFWIETKISAQLIGTDGVSSVNYRWRSVLGAIYIIGEAQSAAEQNAVLGVIKNIKGVKSIVNHIAVRDASGT